MGKIIKFSIKLTTIKSGKVMDELDYKSHLNALDVKKNGLFIDEVDGCSIYDHDGHYWITMCNSKHLIKSLQNKKEHQYITAPFTAGRIEYLERGLIEYCDEKYHPEIRKMLYTDEGKPKYQDKN